MNQRKRVLQAAIPTAAILTTAVPTKSEWTADRVESVYDFLAGRVNRNGSDVLEYSSGNLPKHDSTQ